MKSLIVLVVGLLTVGCGKSKSLTEEEKKVVGSYKRNFEGTTDKLVLHENRVFEGHKNGEKQADGTWKIVGKEVFAEGNVGSFVFKMEQNGDLLLFALISDGKRTDFPNSKQTPLKKLNSSMPIKED